MKRTLLALSIAAMIAATGCGRDNPNASLDARDQAAAAQHIHHGHNGALARPGDATTGDAKSVDMHTGACGDGALLASGAATRAAGCMFSGTRGYGALHPGRDYRRRGNGLASGLGIGSGIYKPGDTAAEVAAKSRALVSALPRRS